MKHCSHRSHFQTEQLSVVSMANLCEYEHNLLNNSKCDHTFTFWGTEIMFSFSVMVSSQAEDPLRVVQNISLHPELNGGGERIISQQALCALKVISVPPADQRLEDKRVSGTLSHPGESMHTTCLIIWCILAKADWNGQVQSDWLKRKRFKGFR